LIIGAIIDKLDIVYYTIYELSTLNVILQLPINKNYSV